jgi:catechol 2,3-dioxygenase-like lactoylglutathione lyase family enzyme
MNTGTQPSGPRFQRANVVVHDLERALEVYRDVLGLEIAFVRNSPPSSYSYVVFGIPREAQLRFCVLSTATQPRVLALTEVRSIEVPQPPVPRRSAVVIEHADLEGVVARLAARGLEVFPQEHLVTGDGRAGTETGFLDDDGNLVVLYRIEATPGG